MGAVTKLVEVVSHWNIIVKFQPSFNVRRQIKDVVGGQAEQTIKEHLTAGRDNYIHKQ